MRLNKEQNAKTTSLGASEPLWTINDVAAYCARSRRTVERWLAARQLPHHRLPSGRPVFRPSRIRELIEGQEKW